MVSSNQSKSEIESLIMNQFEKQNSKTEDTVILRKLNWENRLSSMRLRN